MVKTAFERKVRLFCSLVYFLSFLLIRLSRPCSTYWLHKRLKFYAALYATNRTFKISIFPYSWKLFFENFWTKNIIGRRTEKKANRGRKSHFGSKPNSTIVQIACSRRMFGFAFPGNEKVNDWIRSHLNNTLNSMIVSQDFQRDFRKEVRLFEK